MSVNTNQRWFTTDDVYVSVRVFNDMGDFLQGVCSHCCVVISDCLVNVAMSASQLALARDVDVE